MIDSLYKNKEINEFCKYHVIRNEIETLKLIKRLNLKIEKASDVPTIRKQSFDYVGNLGDEIEFYRSTNPHSEFMTKIKEDFKKVTE